ncbi:MAG: DUF1549 domain-containing protein [Pirellulaceae bacterium]|nr:DUF1549 domain-containing protein [Pirellulaceae bacterium]
MSSGRPSRIRPFLLLLALGCLVGVSAAAKGDEPVSFRRDVMAVLSKAGCNLGACHGNQNGKGGFRLSLRGQEPAFDFASLTKDESQRRVNLQEPESSLILQKAAGQAAHQGGVRFKRDSPEYAILLHWIRRGATGLEEEEPRLTKLVVTPREAVLFEPEQHLQLQVTAHFTDRTSRDVTNLAVYELTTNSVTASHDGDIKRQQPGETTVIVRYLDQQVPVRLAFLSTRPDFARNELEASGSIDVHVFARLQALRMNPSADAGDGVFVRRAYLDAIGILPTRDEVQGFIADAAPDKRERLVDRLLTRPEFAEHWALKWSDLLRNEEKVLDPKGVDLFHGWIRDSIAAGKPLDQFVREMVDAQGSTYANPPANFWRANRDPFTRGETAARLFLGVRLQCAKCHNHPFDRWTQDDYYSWAALFSQIDYKEVGENKRSDKLDLHEFNGEQIVLARTEREVKDPRTGQDAAPKFLGGEILSLEPASNRLPPLAQWLASPANELFVKSQANFVWYHLLGRGLVEPIDDFRLTNPPSHGPLLEELARELASHNFDLKFLVRRIMNSRVYQLAAEPNETNREDETNYSRAIVRRLSAEKLLDAQCQVLDVSPRLIGYPRGTRAGQIRGVSRAARKQSGAADRFLKTFGKPERLLACECERSSETSLKQVFTLIGDEGLSELLADNDNRLKHLLDSGQSDTEIITDLYWTALSREATPDELAAALSLLKDSPDKFASLQDLAWALMNAKEFLFRR